MAAAAASGGAEDETSIAAAAEAGREATDGDLKNDSSVGVTDFDFDFSLVALTGVAETEWIVPRMLKSGEVKPSFTRTAVPLYPFLVVEQDQNPRYPS